MTGSMQLTQNGRDVEITPDTGHITGLVKHEIFACYGEQQRFVAMY